MTPNELLYQAVESEDLALVRDALAQGASASAPGPRGGSALCASFMLNAANSLEIVQTLLDSSPDFVDAAPDVHGMLPLDYAVASTHPLHINAALLAGADPNRLNGKGLPALQQMFIELHDSLYSLRDEDALLQNMAILISRGADPATLNAQGQGFDAFAAQESRPYLADMVKDIQAAQADAIASGTDLATMVLDMFKQDPEDPHFAPPTPLGSPLDDALLEACKLGIPDALGPLVADGADLEASRAKEGSALILAIKSGDLATVKELLSLGADPHREFQGPRGAMLPIHVAASMGSPDMCRALAGAGSDLDARLDGDLTPAMLALVSERWDNLAVLVKLGAKADATSADGQTLEAMAREAGHGDIADWVALATPAIAANSPLPALPSKPRM